MEVVRADACMHASTRARPYAVTLKAVTVTRGSCDPVPYRDDAIGREVEWWRGGDEERREAPPISRGCEPERRASEGERRGSERGSGRGGLAPGRDSCTHSHAVYK